MRYLLLAALALGACSSADLGDSLRSLKGQPSSLAIDRLGLPDRDDRVAGRRVLVWERRHSDVGMAPATATAFGPRGTTTAVGYQPVATVYDCRIRLIVDEREIVTGGDYDGNVGGCAPYVRRLRSSPSDRPRS